VKSSLALTKRQNKGQNKMTNHMVFDCGFPTWALNYAVNGDSTGLTCDEVAMVDDWMENKEFFGSDGYKEFFSKFPAFGLPCMCVDATYCYKEDFEING
jgi:hypothetical protein